MSTEKEERTKRTVFLPPAVLNNQRLANTKQARVHKKATEVNCIGWRLRECKKRLLLKMIDCFLQSLSKCAMKRKENPNSYLVNAHFDKLCKSHLPEKYTLNNPEWPTQTTTLAYNQMVTKKIIISWVRYL